MQDSEEEVMHHLNAAFSSHFKQMGKETYLSVNHPEPERHCPTEGPRGST